MGNMSEMIEDMLWMDYEKQGWDERSEGITCKYCKRSGFIWSKTQAGWRLATPRGVIHTCNKHPRYVREKSHDDGHHDVHQPGLFG